MSFFDDQGVNYPVDYLVARFLIPTALISLFTQTISFLILTTSPRSSKGQEVKSFLVLFHSSNTDALGKQLN